MDSYEIDLIHGQLNSISHIEERSIAKEIGLEVGDQVISINGKAILDVIDYRYNVMEEYIELEVKKRNGDIWIYEVEKESFEDLGITFLDPLLDRQKQCTNNCIFCFIDQMPADMRESLYIKDDDSRLSFLQGNYITLTNLSEEDFKRVIDYKLSPINVSVHTTNPELRYFLLKNPKSKNILTQLKKLTENNIVINAQIVALPDINDGEELIKTLNDLYELGENLASVAIVPVGVTKYRKNYLKTFDRKSSKKIIEIAENLGNKSKLERGFHWVYASDEFYIIAEKEIPKEEYYDLYLQYENGVGLIRSFYEEALEELKKHPSSHLQGCVNLATGEYAYDLFDTIIKKINVSFPRLQINLFKIRNNFFGDSVKVAGLLTARDIIDQLKGRVSGDIMLPRVMFRQDKFITLDDYEINEIEEELDCVIHPSENNGKTFIKKILEVGLHG